MSTFASILGEVHYPDNVPVGPWLLRGLGVNQRDTEYTNRAGEVKQATIFNFAMEPLAPGVGVDPTKVAAGGYEGKKLYHAVFVEYTENDAGARAYDLRRRKQLTQFLEMWGLGEDDDVDAFEGAKAVGTVGLKEKTNREGKTFMDNAISQFSLAETFQAQ